MILWKSKKIENTVCWTINYMNGTSHGKRIIDGINEMIHNLKTN